MKNLTVLFALVLVVMSAGCNTPRVKAQAQEKKIGEAYKVALVQSVRGCTLSPLAWTGNQHVNHVVLLIGFGTDREVALVKVLEGIRLSVEDTEACKIGEVTHVPSRMLLPDIEPKKDK